PVMDIAIFVREGTLLQPDFVRRAQRNYAVWEDLVGKLEVVANVVKVSVDSGSAVKSDTRDGLLHSLVRRWLRARSLMPSVLSLRIAACGNLKFVTFSAFCDWMSFALFLDTLRPRGRTVVAIAEGVQELRLGAERRSGFDLGYELYNRLSRV